MRTNAHTYTRKYIIIYTCVCMCVCDYIRVCVCVCVCVCVYVRAGGLAHACKHIKQTAQIQKDRELAMNGL